MEAEACIRRKSFMNLQVKWASGAGGKGVGFVTPRARVEERVPGDVILTGIWQLSQYGEV